MIRSTSTITLILATSLVFASAALAQQEPSIGFETVSDAMDALLENPAVEIREESGWTIADTEEGDDLVTWTFTSPLHVAHPAVVKRIISRRDGTIQLEMRVLCEAEEDPCAELVAEFQALNDTMRERFRKLYPAAPEN